MANNNTTDILLAGAIAAFTVDLLVYPLDTIKTRIQSPDYRQRYVDASTQTIKKRILFRGLYQGVGSVILATLPSCQSQHSPKPFQGDALCSEKVPTPLIHQIFTTAGAFFTTYEATKSFLQRYAASRGPRDQGGDGKTQSRLMLPTGLPQPLISATASSISELVSCLILTPAEVLKQNAQMLTSTPTSPHSQSHQSLISHLRASSSSSSSSSIHTLRQFRHQPTQLWRGYTALIARNLPFTAIQFPLFEQLKSALIIGGPPHAHDPQPVKTAALTAVCGGVAGSVAAVVTTPVDVVKTRIMLAAAATADEKRRRSAWAVGRALLRDEGVRMLFRGGLLRAVWTALASGLYLGAYETGRRGLEGRRMRRREREEEDDGGFI
ncbi:MAG: hypothetical protein M1816_003764 [Peltula sp. TS41687]|nr:MAG: hypothetical protein M1816_003764 [Peltula sp. TS41687]